MIKKRSEFNPELIQLLYVNPTSPKEGTEYIKDASGEIVGIKTIKTMTKKEIKKQYGIDLTDNGLHGEYV